MAKWQLSGELVPWITHLSGPLHGRIAWRLLPLFTGMLFAQGRKTVARWLRGGGLGRDFRAYYFFLGSLGRKAQIVSSLLVRPGVAGDSARGRVVLGLGGEPDQPYCSRV